MFATLLFFLPVEYEGGQFVIYDPESYINTFVIEGVNKEIPWVAFYTDVRHEVKKIKKGYRVALNYSLCFEGAMSHSPVFPPLSSSAAASVERYFSVYKKNKLSFPLCYEYTLATLSPEYLKGIDAYVYSALHEVSTLELQFVLLFQKTRAIHYRDGDEPHNMQLFQNVYAVDEKKARLFFEISADKEKALEVLDREVKDVYYKNREKVSQEYDLKFLRLLQMVKYSQIGSHTEWVVKRNSFGEPDAGFKWASVSFEQGMHEWLGNEHPAEDYYYLYGAIVARAKGKE